MPDDKTSSSSIEHQAIPFYRDERVINMIAEIISAILIIGGIIWVAVNFVQGANQRGMSLNFRFLLDPAEFPISDPVLPYDPSRSFGYAFLVGLVKTLLVSVLGIIFSTILGTIVGLMRMSSNWLVSRIALAFIEFNRNIPLLVLLFLLYFPVFNRFPPVEESIKFGGSFIINSRGIYLPWARLNEGGSIFVISIIVAIILSYIIWRYLSNRQVQSGRPTYYVFFNMGVLILLPILGWFISGGNPLVKDIPHIDGFNFQGGLRFTPEFAALLVGLTIYTAAFIAEVVRAGIQAVHKGQYEAARAIGLKPLQVLNLVVIPQAMRVMIPPMISQYLNLTKNSSLALFIGYQEVFSVGKIAINQAGRAIPVFAMVMAVYLALSLLTSAVLNWYNRKIQFIER